MVEKTRRVKTSGCLRHARSNIHRFLKSYINFAPSPPAKLTHTYYNPAHLKLDNCGSVLTIAMAWKTSIRSNPLTAVSSGTGETVKRNRKMCKCQMSQAEIRGSVYSRLISPWLECAFLEGLVQLVTDRSIQQS